MKCLLPLWSLCLVLTACQNNPTPSRSQSTSIPSKQSPIVQNPYAPVDVSPIDIAYFPADYPKRSGAEKESEPSARIIYSRPHLQADIFFMNSFQPHNPGDSAPMRLANSNYFNRLRFKVDASTPDDIRFTPFPRRNNGPSSSINKCTTGDLTSIPNKT